MKISIFYDNHAATDGVRADWGFACLVEGRGRRMLFDTGASGPILMANMKALGIDPATVDEVFISHDHWDHTGGLGDFLAARPVTCYVPPCRARREASRRLGRASRPDCDSHGWRRP